MQHGPPDRSPEEEYSFHHILVQQAAYRAIPKSLRAELHHRYADWLEYVAWEPATQRAEILGHHLEQSIRYLSELRPAEAQSSPLPSRAAAHLETAGRAAHDRGDALAAVNLLDRAAALLPGRRPSSRAYVHEPRHGLDRGRAARESKNHARPRSAHRRRRRRRGPGRPRQSPGPATGSQGGPQRGRDRDRSRASRTASRIRSKPGRARDSAGPCGYRPRCTGTT